MIKLKSNLYWLGKEAYINNDYDAAMEYFSEIIKEGYEFADVYNMVGIIHHDNGKFDKAVQALEKAIKLNPKYTDASLNLAVIYNDMGQLEKARKIYAKAKQIVKEETTTDGLDPFSLGKLSNLHANLADIYYAHGIYKEAIKEYQKALALSPDFVDIRTKLGIALRESGKPRESIEELEKALALKPDYTQALLAIGLSHYIEENIEEAKKYWEKALKQNPDEKRAKFYLQMIEADIIS
ncbi:MAG: tetratricopeptide repeat protein [Deltaproteobacteria bacterium]|uniref:Tetratricopeptide repeat protein n=1 Tax=Candidatus Zymogenus saltonus TaxID=2844893 RepID=A0A9D8KDG1_9DELT|nr:tetratricopeptide repeat protein [Candidatus Zymogenus saltonus]